MRSGVLVVTAVLVSLTAAATAAQPQRVYRGRTYLIIDPIPSKTVWYAGDGVVRTEGEHIRSTVTTKRYFAEK